MGARELAISGKPAVPPTCKTTCPNKRLSSLEQAGALLFERRPRVPRSNDPKHIACHVNRVETRLNRHRFMLPLHNHDLTPNKGSVMGMLGKRVNCRCREQAFNRSRTPKRCIEGRIGFYLPKRKVERSGSSFADGWGTRRSLLSL